MENKPTGTIKENLYLARYAYPVSLIKEEPHSDLDIIVTIPCFNEPDLIRSLESLKQCETDLLHAEVIVVINESEKSSPQITQQNEETFRIAKAWSIEHSTDWLRFHILYKNNLPAKHAGVGFARKIAMDQAVRRFECIGKNDGVIACFDADSLCEENYLIAINDFFLKNPKAPGCSIYFEHPLEGDFGSDIYNAIIDYELFLRYYVNALRYAGFPYAYETIGSSMAVRSSAYQKQGGMNRRKAGEDFYFLHKIIPLGYFGEINDTRVIPSPRISERVPFGTGKAVNDWVKNRELLTYSLQTFRDLKIFLDGISELYRPIPSQLERFLQRQPESIRDFLNANNFDNNLVRINNNAASINTFTRQFFQWFDGFKVLKYVHFARDNFYSNQPVKHVAAELLMNINSEASVYNSKQLLGEYRKLDRRRITTQ